MNLKQSPFPSTSPALSLLTPGPSVDVSVPNSSCRQVLRAVLPVSGFLHSVLGFPPRCSSCLRPRSFLRLSNIPHTARPHGIHSMLVTSQLFPLLAVVANAVVDICVGDCFLFTPSRETAGSSASFNLVRTPRFSPATPPLTSLAAFP